MNKKYINILKKLVERALKNDEVPVGALIVLEDNVISKSYNKRNKKKNALMHAEVDAIIKASKKLKDWRLDKCEMYVTLKPCKMCAEIIKSSRIKKVYYLLENNKEIHYNTEFIPNKTDYNEEYKKILSNFFQKKR